MFNYLFAKKFGGAFIVRIEDTDQERSSIEYESVIFEALAWLGFTPDEGPNEGGNFGPYRQSERNERGIYKKELEKLLHSDGELHAFICTHPAAGDENTLLHHCDQLDAREYKHGGIIRLHVPDLKEPIIVQDKVRGQVQFLMSDVGDFSIAKDLDTPLYNFAATVDDHAMQITDVIRGEDHLANTPKQMLLNRTLGYTDPNFYHLPLLLGPDRSKLSKRHGATSVAEFKAAGYLPEALVNYLALLGWNPGTEQEIFSPAELMAAFSIEKVHKSGAIFDRSKLDWLNGEYIRQMPVGELTARLLPFLKNLPLGAVSQEKLEAIVALEQPRLKKLSEIGERVRFYFEPPRVAFDLLQWKGMTEDEVISSLEASIEILNNLLSQKKDQRTDIERALLNAAAKMGDRGKLLWPLRAALSGAPASPGPFDIVELLGIPESIERLRRVKNGI